LLYCVWWCCMWIRLDDTGEDRFTGKNGQTYDGPSWA
jgi:hypothetical protein